MKAAIVLEAGKSPIYGDFKEPIATADQVRVTVTASALSHLTKGRASGTHYSSTAHFPFVVGVDGVGRLDDGRRVYFVLPTAPFGGMAEMTLVPRSQCVVLPDTLNDITAAAIANPGMSAWAAFKERAKLVKGETVLVNGATGTAGRLAVQIAKHMGAKKVIATGRNPEALNILKTLGADITIPLVSDGDALEHSFMEHFACGVDVVIDYLWGQSAERLLIAGAKAGKDGVPIRFVQVGSVTASTLALPSAVLRSSAIELMGSGLGSVAIDRLVSVIGELLQATATSRFTLTTKAIPLTQVQQAWSEEDKDQRIVFTVGDTIKAI
jgi:NADPH:quinone reductase-like Zn-dependent oxidoreductase